MLRVIDGRFIKSGRDLSRTAADPKEPREAIPHEKEQQYGHQVDALTLGELVQLLADNRTILDILKRVGRGSPFVRDAAINRLHRRHLEEIEAARPKQQTLTDDWDR